jgi:HlyD family secretion protein
MSRKKILIGAALLVVIVIIVIITLKKKDGANAIIVESKKIERHTIVQTVTATGRIQPKTQVKISADVAAKIIALPVEEGNWVERGVLLVRLDQERFKAAVEQAEANRRSIEANAQLAKENLIKADKDLARTKELHDKNLESQAMLDQTFAAAQVEKARYQSALEQVDQAKAILKQAKDDLSKTTIYSPMAGTISELNKEVGEIALGSQFQEDVIMVISDLSGMEAEVNVDENDIVSIAIGDSATIEVDALPDNVFKGVVSEIASSASISGAGTTEQKTEFEVKIAVIDPGKSLRPGMTASSDITTETHRDVLGVPIQCVTVRTPDQLKTNRTNATKNEAPSDSATSNQFVPDKDGFVPVVFVVENGVAKAKQVKTGIQSETHIEILDGLSDADEIVTGSFRAISQTVQNNSSVTVEKNTKEK